MRFSEAWLREYANPDINTADLVSQLTMAGLEVESIDPVAPPFSGVVVGKVLSVDSHPSADRLKLCQVDVGLDNPLKIVCGASNVLMGHLFPTAVVGATLPGDLKIKEAKLRGEVSQGMLCSKKELGLAEDAEGLMNLPNDAPVGEDLRDFLKLHDQIIELSLTPNRADCLSVEGVAREVSALNRIDAILPNYPACQPDHSDVFPLSVEAPEKCPKYLGALIHGIDSGKETPIWMQEKLRRSGIRSLGPVIDITNYVLIELGQPLHAFDADKLDQSINVRKASPGEKISLLNGNEIELKDNTLVIADSSKPVALAGIMGGADTAVSSKTVNIFIECAYFEPEVISGKARYYGLHTDSSHRFERGVDPGLQERAINRVCQLIIDIVGGHVGPLNTVVSEDLLPQRKTIYLRPKRIDSILGLKMDPLAVKDILVRQGMLVEETTDGWHVTPPGFRFDIEIEADLIEELARIYGYDQLPTKSLEMSSALKGTTELELDPERVKDLLVDRGYQEVVTFSFVDTITEARLAPNEQPIKLKNPISSELSVMRTTLWSGLITAALRNQNHQQVRIRLFESGLRFLEKDNKVMQIKTLAGVSIGSVYPEQWGIESVNGDFYDMKGDMEAVLSLTRTNITKFRSSEHQCLHPGQAAEIMIDDAFAGRFGMLHPDLEKKFGFNNRVFLFELDQDVLIKRTLPSFKPISKFPSLRRDFALLVDDKTPVSDVIQCIKESDYDHNLSETIVFDVYQGKGVETGKKSIALGLVIQDYEKTLSEKDIDAIVTKVLKDLSHKIKADLRN